MSYQYSQSNRHPTDHQAFTSAPNISSPETTKPNQRALLRAKTLNSFEACAKQVQIQCYLISCIIIMQRQDFTIDEILSSFGQKEDDSQYNSLRISEDYQPLYNRYSKEDQYQDLSLEFEEEDQQIDRSLPEDELKITETASIDKVQFLLENSSDPEKEEGENTQSLPPITTPPILSKKEPFIRKMSIKESVRLKKKISQKSDSDQLTKKYDDLFDEIFYKNKEKEIKKNVSPTEGVSQQSIEGNVLMKSNASTNVDQCLNENMTKLLEFESNEKQSPQPRKMPKVIISYDPKITINIKPQAPKENAVKPTIKFSYGEKISPVKKQPLPFEFIDYNQSEESRLPIFLRVLRSKTNSYPNFNDQRQFTASNCLKFNEQLTECFNECRKAINVMKAAHLTIDQFIKKVRKLYKMMSHNLLADKSAADEQLLKYFLSYEWFTFINHPQIQNIRPHMAFMKRPLTELEFITLLNKYDEISQGQLAKGNILDSTSPASIRDYMNAREKIWAIEKNLRIMAEDLYLYALTNLHIPNHINQSRALLKQRADKVVLKFGKNEAILLERIMFLQEKKDLYSNCSLGRETIQLLLDIQR